MGLLCGLLFSPPLSAESGLVAAAETCRVCHRVAIRGIHRGLACSACHGVAGQVPSPAAAGQGGCTVCHVAEGGVLHGAMATRSAEREFVAATYGRRDPQFFGKNCASCHVASCGDCHGPGHNLALPDTGTCARCHRGYFVGSDYLGLAPRENNLRYQRGMERDGEYYLKMLPDAHFEAGLDCGDCHSMASLAAGAVAAATCTDCHSPSSEPVEHRIAAHLEKLECYACHSAWTAQAYGTFYLRFEDSPGRRFFELKEGPSTEYLEGVYLRKHDAPPLGLNARGRVSPIRPQFIAYTSHMRQDQPVGEENELLGATWKALFPHTVRRGTGLCDSCHGNGRRFLLEEESQRIYDLAEDGMGLVSFWTQEGQRVANGSFFPAPRFERMSAKQGTYRKAYVEKWQRFLTRVGASSAE